MCGRPPVGKDIFDLNAVLVGAAMCSACLCGAVTWPLAIMLSADQVPVISTQSSMLHWLEWSVLIFGSTGWVHYSSIILSNFVCASAARVSSKLPVTQAPDKTFHVPS